MIKETYQESIFPPDSLRRGDDTRRRLFETLDASTKNMNQELAKINQEESIILTSTNEVDEEINNNKNVNKQQIPYATKTITTSETKNNRTSIVLNYNNQKTLENEEQNFNQYKQGVKQSPHIKIAKSDQQEQNQQYVVRYSKQFANSQIVSPNSSSFLLYPAMGEMNASAQRRNSYLLEMGTIGRDSVKQLWVRQDDKSSDYCTYRYEDRFYKDIPTKEEKFWHSGKMACITKFSCILSPIRNFINKIDILIMPDSVIKLLWDTIILCLLIVNIFYIPIKIAFQGGIREEESGVKQNWKSIFMINNLKHFLYFQNFKIFPWLKIILDDIPQWAFLMDIAMNFNMSIYRRGKLITDRRIIAKIYLTERFFWDFIVVTPFLISLYLKVPYVDTILLLRQKKIRIIIRQYEELINLRDNKLAIYKLCKLIIFIIFVGHFSGCLFYFLADIEIKSDPDRKDTWLHVYGFINDGWLTQYIASFYWAVITITTVGYGDIQPQTTLERLFVICVTLISCGVFAYSVNQIGNIVGSMEQRQSNFRVQMTTLTTYMRARNIEKELQMRIKNYFEYLHEENIEENNEGERILESLCDSLKVEVKNQLFYNEIVKQKDFRLNFSNEFLRAFSQKMQEKVIGPEETIFECGGYSNSINLILKGSVIMYIKMGDECEGIKMVKKLGKGQLFGETSFFSGQRTQVGAKTKNVCRLMTIKKTQFLETLKDFPLDYEKYCNIRDQIWQKNDQKSINTQCQVCNSFTHEFTLCHFVNYIPQRDRILYKYHKEDMEQQSRISNHSRKQRSKETLNALVNEYEVKVKAFQHAIENCDPEEIDAILANFEQGSSVAGTPMLYISQDQVMDKFFLQSPQTIRSNQFSISDSPNVRLSKWSYFSMDNSGPNKITNRAKHESIIKMQQLLDKKRQNNLLLDRRGVGGIGVGLDKQNLLKRTTMIQQMNTIQEEDDYMREAFNMTQKRSQSMDKKRKTDRMLSKQTGSFESRAYGGISSGNLLGYGVSEQNIPIPGPGEEGSIVDTTSNCDVTPRSTSYIVYNNNNINNSTNNLDNYTNYNKSGNKDSVINQRNDLTYSFANLPAYQNPNINSVSSNLQVSQNFGPHIHQTLFQTNQQQQQSSNKDMYYQPQHQIIQKTYENTQQSDEEDDCKISNMIASQRKRPSFGNQNKKNLRRSTIQLQAAIQQKRNSIKSPSMLLMERNHSNNFFNNNYEGQNKDLDHFEIQIQPAFGQNNLNINNNLNNLNTGLSNNSSSYINTNNQSEYHRVVDE